LPVSNPLFEVVVPEVIEFPVIDKFPVIVSPVFFT
jgi:hypothetical protein